MYNESSHAFARCANKRDYVQSGLIINIASVASLSPMPETAVYATSKWGLRGWSLSCYEVG